MVEKVSPKKLAELLQQTIQERDVFERALDLACAERATISGAEDGFRRVYLEAAEAPERSSLLNFYRSRAATRLQDRDDPATPEPPSASRGGLRRLVPGSLRPWTSSP